MESLTLVTSGSNWFAINLHSALYYPVVGKHCSHLRLTEMELKMHQSLHFLCQSYFFVHFRMAMNRNNYNSNAKCTLFLIHFIILFDVERENCMFSGLFSLSVSFAQRGRCYVVVDRCCCLCCCWCCSCCCCRFQCPPADNICWRRENQNSKYRRKNDEKENVQRRGVHTQLTKIRWPLATQIFSFFFLRHKIIQNDSHFLSSIQHYEMLRLRFSPFDSIRFETRTKHAAVNDGRKEAANEEKKILNYTHRTPNAINFR